MLKKLREKNPWLYNAVAFITTSAVCTIVGLTIFNLSGDIIRTLILTGLVGFGLGAFVFPMES
jgi:hypothetical protein